MALVYIYTDKFLHKGRQLTVNLAVGKQSPLPLTHAGSGYLAVTSNIGIEASFRRFFFVRDC
jgi:hypothetical protein